MVGMSDSIVLDETVDWAEVSAEPALVWAEVAAEPETPRRTPWRLIRATGRAIGSAAEWLVAVFALTWFHVAVACLRGGRLRHFFWPFGHPFWLASRLRRGGLYVEARDALWVFVTSLRLPYYFRVGLVGFLGTLAWLAPPA